MSLLFSLESVFSDFRDPLPADQMQKIRKSRFSSFRNLSKIYAEQEHQLQLDRRLQKNARNLRERRRYPGNIAEFSL
jgi:hypothetical protein